MSTSSLGIGAYMRPVESVLSKIVMVMRRREIYKSLRAVICGNRDRGSDAL